MDGQRFDALTRLLAGSLPRRRLLRRATGALAGALLAGRAARTLAACDTPPNCPEGQKSCGNCGCIPSDGVCCSESVYCPAQHFCCGSESAGWACCAQHQFLQEFCCRPGLCCQPGQICGESGFCQNSCPAGTTRCGGACCSSDQECVNDRCQAACPSGTTRCGETNCCGDGQSCDNGQCVDACPVGVAAQRDGGRRSRRREVTAEACEPEPPPPCPSGTVKCRGACVPACTGKSSLDGNTCKCSRKKCPDGKLKCDGKCIDPQTDRTHCGGCASADGASCGAGPCCQGQCQAGGSTCCGAQVCSAGEACCGQPKKCCPASQCCGPGCCPDGQYCARSNAKVGLCCPNGQQDCNSGCCAPGEVCASFRKSVCCPQDRPRYCAKTSQCVENRKACK